MFRCAVTGSVSKPREQMIKLVVAQRTREYEVRNAEGELVRIARGREIVKQIPVTQAGYDKLNKRYLIVNNVVMGPRERE